jgi:DNA-binding beta-propeller fold protein YncE
VQERPGTSQVFIIGGKRITIIDNTNGDTIKDIIAESEIQPFTFLDKSSYAYSYNMGKLKLSILNLDTLQVEKTMAAGSAGLAAFKAVTAILSVVAYSNSLQPHYVGRVQVPSHVSSIYWVHTPKGNMVTSPDQKKLYLLNSFLAEIYTYDIQKGIVAKKLGYLGGKSLYLQIAPNGRYVILIAGDNWKLLNIATDKAVLTFSPNPGIGFAFQEVTAPTPYFSPDGSKMYIPNNSKVMVIDLEIGKKLASLGTKTKDAMIFW